MEVDYEKYKNHPRIIEIRFILLFDMFVREYGYQDAVKFYEAISAAFYCDMGKIHSLINQRFELKRLSKTKRLRWRQEVIFTALCYEETIYKVAKDYLIMNSSNIYAHPELYNTDEFVTDDWLRMLDDETILCGVPAYSLVVKRFFEVVDNLTNVLVRWKG